MEREPNFTIDVQDFLAVSARYLGLATEISVAHSDWASVPAAEFFGADRSGYRHETLGQHSA